MNGVGTLTHAVNPGASCVSFILFCNLVILVDPPRKVYLFRFHKKLGSVKAEVQWRPTDRFGASTNSFLEPPQNKKKKANCFSAGQLLL